MRFLKFSHYLPTVNGLLSNTIHRRARFPFYASFKITSRCHFGCPFCNVKKKPVEDLSLSSVKKILDNLSESSVLMTSLEGGEPLLRDDIYEILQYARPLKFHLLFTTSCKDLLDYPLEKYAPLIDFLHISIDEGHNNLEMFDHLPDLSKLPTQISVQTVVTNDTVESLDQKIETCNRNGVNIVVIPASPMEGARNCFPDQEVLENKIIDLKKRYPSTIHTPNGYFKAFKSGRCSSSSIIIAPSGKLYYPCHIQGHEGPDLTQTNLMRWLKTSEAEKYRTEMKHCDKNCGWYQYYSIDSYTSPFTFWDSIKPMILQKKKRM